MIDATSSGSKANGVCPVLPEDVDQVLNSHTFEKAPALRALLAYLWEHRDASLSEYAIAVDALGRSKLFDARTDATVRVQVSRLRQRLERYYEKENIACRYRLVIPLGSHQITWELQPGVAPNEEKERLVRFSFPELAPEPTSKPSRSTPVVKGLLVALTVLCLLEASLLYRFQRERTLAKSQPAPKTVPWVWKNFFGNGHSTRITLPTPIFFSFDQNRDNGRAAIMFRDTEINDFSDGSQSQPFRLLEKTLGRPTLAENYTVTSDTFASVRLARYFDEFGVHTEVASSADNPLAALDHDNLIAVGTWGTLGSLKPFLDKMDFRLGRHEESVLVDHPEPGEPTQVQTVYESPDRGIWPGVIAFLPGNGGQTHLLILASRHTSALVTFLTSSDGLRQLERLWKQKHSPEYFEVIVNAELSGRNIVVRAWPVALHEYRQTP